MDKPSLVQQFCKWTVITFVVQKIGAIALALLCLMAGWQADKTVLNSEILLQIKYFSFLCVDKGTVLI